MKRIGFLLKVSQDRIEEYKARHKAVWPEMQEALRRSGWHNYSLFLADDGLLFGYFETPVDLQTAVASMGKEEVNARWQDWMAPSLRTLAANMPMRAWSSWNKSFISNKW